MINEFKNYNRYVPPLEEVPEGKLRILVKKVGKAPEIRIIDDTLKAKQNIVDGLIEVVTIDEDESILLVCNEEGKLLGKEPNIQFDYDTIVGDCFFIGENYEDGDWSSLTREQIINVQKMLQERSFRYLSEEIEDGKEK